MTAPAVSRNGPAQFMTAAAPESAWSSDAGSSTAATRTSDPRCTSPSARSLAASRPARMGMQPRFRNSETTNRPVCPYAPKTLTARFKDIRNSLCDDNRTVTIRQIHQRGPLSESLATCLTKPWLGSARGQACGAQKPRQCSYPSEYSPLGGCSRAAVFHMIWSAHRSPDSKMQLLWLLESFCLPSGCSQSVWNFLEKASTSVAA